MNKLKSTLGIVAIALITLTAVSCKDAKKEHNNEEEHHSEMNHDNSDGHHDEEMTHDNSDGHHNGDSAEMSSAARDIDVSTQKNEATSAIIDAYLQIKNALVTDSKENAAKGGTALLAAFSKFNMKTLTDGTRKEYMEIAESAKEQAEHIIENPIDHQREHFETLSTDISDLITLLGTDKTLYLDYCPMKKVSWLSEIKEIKNPFYGSEMLTCGNVKKQIN
tara:strand:- start:342 stop:1004 length:663 start_codon:yes stop_codon:yes gene_type:complete